MFSRGKQMCQLVLKAQLSTNAVPSSNAKELITKTVEDGENEHPAQCLENVTSENPTQDSLKELGNSNSAVAQGSRCSHTLSFSSSRSSSCSCSSSSRSESSSEDCEDLINDKSYLRKSDEESDETDSKEDNADDHAGKSTSDLNTTNPSTSTQDVPVLLSPAKKGVKRKRDTEKWKRNVLKTLRNCGEAYETHTRKKKIRKRREIKAPCGEKCKLKCSSKFSQEERQQIFSAYWSLGDMEKQREFINNSMTAIVPQYRYIRVGGTRKQRQNNNAYYFTRHGLKVRVCKVFFENTLDINDRTIRTVQEKRNKVAGVLLEPDQRGKHGKQKVLDPAIREGIREHINSIPRIESHYTRANTSRTFIEGSRSLADIHRDYISNCKGKNKPYGSYAIFHRVFTEEFNISFFVPKKDLCETCVAYENAGNEEKEHLKDEYDRHLAEKTLSREEKKRDKENNNFNGILAVYDLQAVLQVPKGEVSAFFYKSKLNVLNFTIYDLQTNNCECYVWDESNGHRGVNELGTCILKYLQKKATMTDSEVIFYSDNCVGQQKNKFMLGLYLYAVRCLGVKSITHKFLIKGHTQNEGDGAHSLIERQVKRQLRGGAIYTPDAFIAAIRAAKKQGTPFTVNELCYEDFYDLKQLSSDIGPLTMAKLKLTYVKVIKVVRESPASVYYKNSYKDEFQEVKIITRKKQVNDSKICLKLAFNTKPGLAERKKSDLMDLINKNHIPKYYINFYKNL